MSNYCYEAHCIKKIPDEKDYCPEHELHYTADPNIVEYLEGLAPLAENIAKLTEGSKLNQHELASLAYIQGYLSAAKHHIKSLKGAHEPVQP